MIEFVNEMTQALDGTGIEPPPNEPAIAREDGRERPMVQAVVPIRLAEPSPDGRPMQTRELVRRAIDRSMADVVAEIDNLAYELEQIKARLVQEAELCKEVLDKHFNVQGEAIAHAERIRNRLQHLASGGELGVNRE